MANRFWKGTASGNLWSNTSNWASTSGGAGGASVPSASDDVFFDNTTSSGNCIIAANATCRSVDMNGFTTTITVTLNAGVTLSVGTSTNNASNIAWRGSTTTLAGFLGNSDASSVISFVGSNATANTVNFGTQSTTQFPGTIKFNGTGSWTLNTNGLNAQIIDLTQGTLTTSNLGVNATSFVSSNTNTRTLTMGSSAFTLSTVNGSAAWDTTTSTNFTLTPGTSTVTISGGDLKMATTSAQTLFNVTFDCLGGTGLTANTIYGTTPTFSTLRLQSTVGASFINLDSNITCTVNFRAVGFDSGANRIVVASSTFGTARTISIGTAGVAGTASMADCDFQDLTFANVKNPGTAYTGTRTGDLDGVTGDITLSPPATIFWVGGTGNWSDATNHWRTSTGGAVTTRVPLPQDTMRFDNNSFSGDGQTVTFDSLQAVQYISNISVTATNFTHTLTASIPLHFYKNVTLTSSSTLSNSSGGWAIRKRGTQTWTTASATLSPAATVTVQSLTGTWQLQDNISFGQTILIINGTLDANGNSITCSAITDFGPGTKALTLGSGKTLALMGTGTVFTFHGSGSTLTTNGANILIGDNTSATKTFIGEGKTWGNLSILGGSGSGTLVIQSSSTYNSILTVFNASKTIQFTAGTTQTLSTASFCSGTSGLPVTCQSTSNGSAWTISCGSKITTDYVSLQDSTVAGAGGAFEAGMNSTNVSGNTGWYFRKPQIQIPVSQARGMQSVNRSSRF